MLFFVDAWMTIPVRTFRGFKVALILETTYIKLVLWNDPGSWSLGIVAGFAMGLAWVAARDRNSGRGVVLKTFAPAAA